jgi:hypothetical protein
LKERSFGQIAPLIHAAVFLCSKTIRTAALTGKGGCMKRINSLMADGEEVEKMTVNYEKTLQKLEQAEAKLLKISEKKKGLEAAKKALQDKAETERLSSRGMILESFLKEPQVLTNEDISSLLGLLFRSSFSQKRLEELISARKGIPVENATDATEEPA